MKKCEHKVTYYSKEKKDFICQFCGKVVGELRLSKKKAKKKVKEEIKEE